MLSNRTVEEVWPPKWNSSTAFGSPNGDTKSKVNRLIEDVSATLRSTAEVKGVSARETETRRERLTSAAASNCNRYGCAAVTPNSK